MHPLVHLALIWTGVFAAVVAANKTRLTPVLFYLFIGFIPVNIGVLPERCGTADYQLVASALQRNRGEINLAVWRISE